MTIRDRIRTVLAAEAAAIANVRVTAAFEDAVHALRSARGKVVTTGMGKAGHVARKVAATLCSTGTPAAYLHPGEAAHGDLGILAPGDVLLAFSTSGRTTEVLDVIERGRALGLQTVIGITSRPLMAGCDLVLDMGVIPEPCPHGLTPSASTAVMLAIGDALALALLDAKQIPARVFFERHHGGYLGTRSDIGAE